MQKKKNNSSVHTKCQSDCYGQNSHLSPLAALIRASPQRQQQRRFGKTHSQSMQMGRSAYGRKKLIMSGKWETAVCNTELSVEVVAVDSNRCCCAEASLTDATQKNHKQRGNKVKGNKGT